MKSAAAMVSLIYLIFVGLFLYFQALWICDGYFPVGWGVRGSLIHIGMWSLPTILVVGCVMLAIRFRCGTALILVLTVIAIFMGIVIWALVTPDGLTSEHEQNTWLYLWLLAPVLAAVAARSLYLWSSERGAQSGATALCAE